MANAVSNTIYNYYMTTYYPRKSDARLDSHNTNELKNIYGKILKINKEAPLYLYDRSLNTASFALSLKENTRQLQYTILDSAGSKTNDLFQNEVALSSDEDIVSAKYIGHASDTDEDSHSYAVRVYSLATGQVNLGKFLPSEERSLDAGTYNLSLNFHNLFYEFQVSVEKEDTNIDIQSRLARLLNQTIPQLHTSVVEGENDTSCLKIESFPMEKADTGLSPSFTIQRSSSLADGDITDYLGIDYVAAKAEDAHFSVNGEDLHSSANHVFYHGILELSLKGVPADPETDIRIEVENNVHTIKDNVRNLISGYNTFLEAVDQYKNMVSSNKLSFEMQSLAKLYRNELDAVGIALTESGTLSIDDHLLTQTVQSEDAGSLLSPLKDFSSSLFDKSEDISRDPLNYTRRVMVAYKNPGKNFPSPYAASSYSGLLFNYYC